MNEFSRIGLGTAQWGSDYGIANISGKVSSGEVSKILVEAKKNGISMIDSASLYGDAESVIGENRLSHFRVVTKTPKFKNCETNNQVKNHLRTIFFRSLHRFKLNKIYGLLIHDVNDLLSAHGHQILNEILELQDGGFIDKVGVSVYNENQLDSVLDIFKPDIVQLPVNLLDQRFVNNGYIRNLKSNHIEIHARSVFLQGLLLMPLEKIPTYFSPILPKIMSIHAMAGAQGVSLHNLALSYVKNLKDVDVILVGVDSLQQFNQCIQEFERESIFDAKIFSCNDEAFINPSLWMKIHEKS